MKDFISEYINTEKLCKFCDLISVGTACGPAVKWAREKLDTWTSYMEEDGFLLLLPPEGKMEHIKILYVAHIDEIGGIVMSPAAAGRGFKTRIIGTSPQAFSERPLIAMDYLDNDGNSVRECSGIMSGGDLLVSGKDLQPFRTVFTFDEKTSVYGEWIEGKAIDPRVTACGVIEAASMMKRSDVAVMLVFAEECSMFAAKKGAYFAADRFTSLSLIVNCDVPGFKNVEGGHIEKCIIRLYEGKNLIDPSFGIAIYEKLVKKGCTLSMGATLTGSQTSLFIPLCHTISLAVPAEEAHVARTRASLKALEDLIKVLVTIPEVAIKS
jgi:putative aminopeptidase FrvX